MVEENLDPSVQDPDCNDMIVKVYLKLFLSVKKWYSTRFPSQKLFTSFMQEKQENKMLPVFVDFAFKSEEKRCG